MDILLSLVDFTLHVDKHLGEFVQAHGLWIYALLFLIVFVETGLLVMPFLPGDSMLFVIGALAAGDKISLSGSMGVLMAAAILGDQLNYSIGRHVGPRVFQWEKSRWFNRDAFNAAHQFYEKRGGMTIVLARFMPFVRTFAPFVAGVVQMSRAPFTAYNVAGGVLWVLSLTMAGYWFGNIEWVQLNLSKIILAMIFIPGLIALAGAWRAKQSAAKAA
jgi:membrane-associated protein